jgi:hypothetical protein
VQSAVGVALRGGGGIGYFVFDWLGFGLEAGMSLGRAFYADDYMGNETYAVFDFGGGVEFQF